MHGRRARHARRGQLHGHARPRPDLPGARGGPLRRARPVPDDDATTRRRSAPPSRCRSRRAPGCRRASRPPIAPTRSGSPSTPPPRPATSSSRGTCSRCGRAATACSSGWGRPRRRSTSPAWPASCPPAMICEIMNDDGTMARVPDLAAYCVRHGLKMITVSDLVAYRRRTERLVERIAVADMPTKYGPFAAYGYRSVTDGQQHVALVCGEVAGQDRRARAGALGVPDRRRLRVVPVRLRRAARAGALPDRAGRLRGAAVPGPGGSRHRPPEQAARLRAAGARLRHGRRQHPPRLPGGLARLQRRLPDPGRPRPDVDPRAHQQPAQARGSRRLRAHGHRAPADRGRAEHVQRRVPAHEARADGPHPAPPGPAARATTRPRSARVERPGRGHAHGARGLSRVDGAADGRDGRRGGRVAVQRRRRPEAARRRGRAAGRARHRARSDHGGPRPRAPGSCRSRAGGSPRRAAIRPWSRSDVSCAATRRTSSTSAARPRAA